MNMDQLYWFAGVVVVGAPAALLLVLGLTALMARPLPEKGIARATRLAIFAGLLASIAILLLMLYTGDRSVPFELGNWVLLHEEGFHVHLKLVFDRLSVPLVILSFVLTGTIGGFARSYLHRESGYQRYFLLYAVFVLGLTLSLLAGTIEMLFIGWELVGLSSALLVAYFQERPEPVRNGLHVWTVYRVADAAFLVAAIALHHAAGAGEFSEMMVSGTWPDGQSSLTSSQAFFVGLLLLVAAAGKSALIPFSGWLPRAMEGPTPSSAIFYGALSVHLGAFLMLRFSPILDSSPPLAAVVVALGVLTAVFASITARVQTDVKSAIAFASMTQVGIIFAEIGLGLHYLAVIHIIGHACLRTLQLLRAPTLFHDYRLLENAMGVPSTHTATTVTPPARWRRWWYRFALDRGNLDRWLIECLVDPFLQLFRRFDRWERRWTRWLSGKSSSDGEQPQRPFDGWEDWR